MRDTNPYPRIAKLESGDYIIAPSPNDSPFCVNGDDEIAVKLVRLVEAQRDIVTWLMKYQNLERDENGNFVVREWSRKGGLL